ncbi:MAG TPA: hypothetical protein DF383_02930 [Deltaproteobacteria bacterium]|nr:hypothetical protein [Deltaproteobacteria bacterium]
MSALLVLMAVSSSAFAPPIGFSGNPYPPPGGSSGRPRTAIPQTVNPPFMYDPDHDLYDWKIQDEGSKNPPCYYDEYYGQWVGNCNLYRTAPGYSITVPNRVR